MSIEAYFNAHYADVRARLRGRPVPPVIVALEPALTTAEVEQEPDVPAPQKTDREWIAAVFDEIARHKIQTVGGVRRATAKVFGFSVPTLVKWSRRKERTRARLIGMAISVHVSKLSYQRIAEFFGVRDHTPVLNAVRKYGALVADVASEVAEKRK